MIVLERQPPRCHISSMAKSPKRPRDPNQLAKLVIDIATGEASEAPVTTPQQRGLKGGKARAEVLSPARRVEIAKKAGAARWGAKSKTAGEP